MNMTDGEFRKYSFWIFVAIVILLVAIPATMWLQQDSVHEVRLAPNEPDELVATVSAAEEPEPEVIDEPEPRREGLVRYVVVNDSCGPHYEGECLRVRSGPGEDYPVVSQLREGIVLKVNDLVKGEDRDWYHIEFDEWLRYPERLSGEWYIAAEFVEEVYLDPPVNLSSTTPTSSKRVVVDRSDQKLYAYDDEELFMEADVSTGLEFTPTPRGIFTIFRKTPSRYMQGPLPYLPVSKYYDLPGVPWNLYFTEQGAVIHGAYWHDSFGSQYSSGCVNLPPEKAKLLYEWADIGSEVWVRD
tara:strand:+ start:219 stop:1115 length:897 start_codon:yes stop_codon:yes gene_type:complete